ncbi:hypothetical protein PVAP13_8KG169610 [Panicum virgatum]|uniref:Uncharacterized protein n=1 Tax=Panicum virgatum TaxID=38727 RepID=A0A8T0PN23_PANVG|nr:hypothetical protein PVAP13_8KG169610 [Panicum virgatum]
MVDSITDAVKNAIIRGNQSGGIRRFMVQGAICHALRNIHLQRIPLRRSNGHHERHSPALGLVLYIRDTRMAPLPTVAPMPLAPPRNDSGGAMAGRRGAPPFPISDVDAEKWPPGFAYDITIAPPPPHRSTSCAPTPTSPPIAATHSHPRLILGPDSSPPRRGRFPASKRGDKGRSGPICSSRLAPMAGVPGGERGRRPSPGADACAALGRGATDGGGRTSANTRGGADERRRGRRGDGARDGARYWWRS